MSLPSFPVDQGICAFALFVNYLQRPIATCEVRFVEGA
jgi:hypothetical protein